jgi:AraC-like DNA-binding protein
VGKRTHRVVQHRSGIPGIEAMTMSTEHAFPRHSHDHFGVGLMTSGAQRSWSLIGNVESKAGDVIMLNPGEMHDGAPVGGVRSWRIIYVDPALVAREMANDSIKGEPLIHPVARDPHLAAHIVQVFEQLENLAPDCMLAEQSLLFCLMYALQKHGIDGPRPVHASPSVARSICRLEAAPEVATSLAELAMLSDMSRFQLLRGFFREVGVTPHAYLVQLRVKLVRRHLALGRPPAEAAVMAGFADQSHMSRAFVRQFGVTPGRYQAALA